MVHFVGGGPGAPDLLTVRAAELVAAADVVVWGARLLMEGVVTRYARPGAELVRWPPATMGDIRAVYERAAQEGLKVTRVYAGDPTVLARIHQEIEDVTAWGLPFEVVPGVSAATAAAAAAVWDLTGGNEQTRPLVLTTRDRGFPDASATAAVFLAGRKPQELQDKLLATGYAADTPCLIAIRVSWPDERLVNCPLTELAENLGEDQGGDHTLVLVGRGSREGAGRGRA